MDGLILIVDRCNYVKKNCKHEYKEIDYQLKIQKKKKKKEKRKRKRKKETWYLQPWKRKSSTNLYIVIFQKNKRKRK